ncbi:MAG: hypothetical protein WC254_07750 [Candidatus Woesearchaeota archaeon]|jgi:hypothetical protein
MTTKEQTFEFKTEILPHKYHPVKQDGLVYFPGNEELEVSTEIDTKIKLFEPYEGKAWYQSNFWVKFDLDETNSRIKEYTDSVGLRKTHDYLRLNEETRRCLFSVFPNQSASVEITIHAENSHVQNIFLRANQIYGSLALKIALESIINVYQRVNKLTG